MLLSRLQVSLYHENCWTAELMELLPENTSVVPVSRNRVNGVTTTWSMIRTSKSEAKKVKDSERLSRFKPQIIGSLSKSHSQVFLFSFTFKSPKSVYQKLRKFEAIVPLQETYSNGIETWNLLISNNFSKDYRDRILSEIESVSKILSYNLTNGDRLFKEYIDEYLALVLDQRTISVLKNLSAIGYFDFPRKMTTVEAALKLQLSKGFISKVSRKIFDVLKYD